MVPVYFSRWMKKMTLAAFAPEKLRCSCPRARTYGGRLPEDVRGEYGGWGGYQYFETEPGASRPPVIFVHGNKHDACDWDSHAEFLLEHGFSGDELWAISFSDPTPSHDQMAIELDRFITAVLAVTDSEQVQVVSHSLGVTGARFWMDEYDAYDRVDTFVGLAGANHGTALCPFLEQTPLSGPHTDVCDFIGIDRLDDPSHPLNQLNQNETPGDVDYYTIRGAYDEFFLSNPMSPCLEGAEANVRILEDHTGVRDSSITKQYLLEWLS